MCFSNQSDIVRLSGKYECTVHVDLLCISCQSLLFIVF